jgi:hypothetical protein
MALIYTSNAKHGWFIQSFHSKTWYTVDSDKRVCTCPAYNDYKGCKHLHELGIRPYREFTPQIEPSFSQALSTFIKSIRLRNVPEAMYWLVYLDSEQFKDSKYHFRLARRLLVGAAEDGHSIAVMEKVAENFPRNSKVKTDLMYLAGDVIRICNEPNWWHPASGGQDYIYHGMVANRRLMHGMTKDEDNLKLLLAAAIDQQDKTTALTVTMGMGHMKRLALAEYILYLATERDSQQAMRLAQIHVNLKNALYGDNNFLCQAVWIMAGGKTPIADSIKTVYAADAITLIQEARKQWHDPHPVPTWGCDGIHCGGNDPRFAGAWNHMNAVCEAYKHYGRVSPEDKWLSQFMVMDGLNVKPLSAVA